MARRGLIEHQTEVWEKKSTGNNGGFHMWKMHSLEHTDISTHSVINLFLLSLSYSLYVSPRSASHLSFFAKSYETDFLSSASLRVIAVIVTENCHYVSLFSIMRWNKG